MHKRLVSLLAAISLVPGLALAHGPSSHGHARYYPRNNVQFGVTFGSGLYSPGYYSNYWYAPPIYTAPVYSAPPVVIQTQPPVYIERPAAVTEAPASAYWHYCAPTQSYYPYVSECAQAWQRVSPVPPTSSAPRP